MYFSDDSIPYGHDGKRQKEDILLNTTYHKGGEG